MNVKRMIYKILQKLNLNKCLTQGRRCRFYNNAKIYNHSYNPTSINLGNGVFIDAILQVYEHGKLFIDDYTFVGNSRIFCANQVFIGKGCWIADHSLSWIVTCIPYHLNNGWKMPLTFLKEYILMYTQEFLMHQ